MLVKPEDARVGDDILFKRSGPLAAVLSLLLVLIDPKPKWDRWGWHVGYILKILPDGEVVTSQAIANGVEPVTYPSIQAIEDCRFYHWLDNVDQDKLDDYFDSTHGEPYDAFDHPWVILGLLSEKLFHWPWRIVDKAKMCWENVSEKNRHFGKELQPEYEPVLLNRMVNKWETG